MELVIKIDDGLYNQIFSDAEIMIYGGMRNGKTLLATLLRAIRNGTPLPKGHGDLKDAKSINTIIRPITENDENWAMTAATAIKIIHKTIDKMPTIIEADKE